MLAQVRKDPDKRALLQRPDPHRRMRTPLWYSPSSSSSSLLVTRQAVCWQLAANTEAATLTPSLTIGRCWQPPYLTQAQMSTPQTVMA